MVESAAFLPLAAMRDNPFWHSVQPCPFWMPSTGSAKVAEYKFRAEFCVIDVARNLTKTYFELDTSAQLWEDRRRCNP